MLTMLRRISSRVLRLAADLVEPLDVSPGKRPDDDAPPANPPARLEEDAYEMIATPSADIVTSEAPAPKRGSLEARMRASQ